MPPPVRSSPEPTSGSVPVRARWLLACCLGLAVATLAGEARPDLGAFPGANGLIAFQSFRDGSSQIYLETVPPTPVRRLTDPQALLCASGLVAGRQVDRLRVQPEPDRRCRPGASDIYVMNPPSGAADDVRRLTSVPGFDGDPAWSPDGRQIVFESTRSGNSDIWVMNADGTNPRDITAEEPGFRRRPGVVSGRQPHRLHESRERKPGDLPDESRTGAVCWTSRTTLPTTSIPRGRRTGNWSRSSATATGTSRSTRRTTASCSSG